MTRQHSIPTMVLLTLTVLIQIYTERAKRQEKYKERSCMRKFKIADKMQKAQSMDQDNRKGSLKNSDSHKPPKTQAFVKENL